MHLDGMSPVADTDPGRLLDRMAHYQPPQSLIDMAKKGLLDIKTRG